MTNDQLNNAFTTALTEYESVSFRPPIDHKAAEYFFWAGSEFGCNATAGIYRETYGDTHVSDKMLDATVGESA